MSRIQSWHDVTEGMHTRSYEGASKYRIYSYAFFNGADVNSKKPSWVTWKSVLAAKDVGGLGVSSLFALNRALMFKWVLRFFSQKNSSWVRVVKLLHGEDGRIGKKVQPMYPSTWLNIINEIESLKLHGIDLVSFITPKLGNRANTSFWDVAWCGDIAFKNLVPRLYALESMKNIEVASKLSYGGLKFSFRRNPRCRVEQAKFERLKEMVEGVTLSNSNDRWSWSLVGSDDFSVSSVRKLIDNAILPKGISKTRWIKEMIAKSIGFVGILQASNVVSSFRRPPRSSIENSQFIELGQILSSISLSSVSDRWSWTLHRLGDFSVKSAREEIEKHVLVVSPLKIDGPRWPPRVTLGSLLPHARGLGFKPRRGGFPSGAKKEWGLSPKTKVRVLHTAQLNVT
nr:RNA-directed DNA polymerase, eukaryota, reverse transcriptase zinc-binding domain protein [Tanacetum cinerariifolium]